MFDVFEKFATDEIKEESGVKVSLGKGVSLTIARSDNSKFLKLLQEEADRVAETVVGLNDKEAEAVDKQAMLFVLAKTILLGWEGVAYKGKMIKYSIDNAVMLLGHKDFSKLVMKHAGDIELYRAKLESDDEKN